MPDRFEPTGFRRISVAAPDLSGNEAAYVVEAVRSGWVSSTGAFLERFEHEFAAACGTRRPSISPWRRSARAAATR
jgi:dTDP-4-amino-4,6-dideoxygalactose transaminase